MGVLLWLWGILPNWRTSKCLNRIKLMNQRWLKKENIEPVDSIKGRKDPKGISFFLSAGVVLCFFLKNMPLLCFYSWHWNCELEFSSYRCIFNNLKPSLLSNGYYFKGKVEGGYIDAHFPSLQSKEEVIG